ncbi:MAG: hypothetical protein ACRD6I_02835 [Candidatus Acidiferrales bacterium]
MLVEYGLNTELHWKFIPPGQNVQAYAAELVSLLVQGAVLGSAQAWILRSRAVRVAPWILSATAGFGFFFVVEWSLLAVDLWGRFPGPVEPIMILLGGGSLSGVFQYLGLRRQGIHARKWLALWIAGLVASLVPTALLFMSIEGLGVSLSWPMETFLSGFMTAGVAAWISGKALFAAIPHPPPIQHREGF